MRHGYQSVPFFMKIAAGTDTLAEIAVTGAVFVRKVAQICEFWHIRAFGTAFVRL